MKLSELNILPTDHSVFSVGPVWIGGVRYDLGDDGDTLIETPETEEQKQERMLLIQFLEKSLKAKD